MTSWLSFVVIGNIAYLFNCTPVGRWLYDGSDLKYYLLSGRGLMLWLFVGPTGVYLLDVFCSGIQFYLLLSPYLCFISYLNLD